jgi:hypothetical protein
MTKPLSRTQERALARMQERHPVGWVHATRVTEHHGINYATLLVLANAGLLEKKPSEKFPFFAVRLLPHGTQCSGASP